MSISSRFVSFMLPAAMLALTAGCPGREVSKVDPNPTKEQGKEIPVNINRNVDILFVVDNSNSMQDEQTSLTANFDRFIGVLESIEGGLPNVHIGVISTDMGTGPHGNDTGCQAGGDEGNLINSNGGCQGPSDKYIEDVGNPDGTRTTNYSGELSDTFSCIANLGVGGCGFEQQLESMRAALDGNQVNQGFLRDNAFLAVIFITDEDDCSVDDPAMFSGAQNSIDSELGPLSSFRCFEFGVECEPDDPRSPGPRQNCQPRNDSPYMANVQEYVDFLKGLKEDPRDVIVAGIIGVPTPVAVEIGGAEGDVPSLVPSCSSGAGQAAPAVRLASFLSAFPERNTLQTICDEDLSDALVLVANLLATVIGNPCIEGDLADSDESTDGVQPDCSVTDVQDLNTEDEVQTVLPSCEQSSSLPCWQFINDAACSDTPTGLALQVCRGLNNDDPGCPDGAGVDPPLGTTTVVRCLAN